mmetsp:Transcript_14734/g.23966  ORF Transcript_14734/g.23966 Transcript_14734/m.23966 type:complete len:217 (+) Transcript_14734:461-1111(+)
MATTCATNRLIVAYLAVCDTYHPPLNTRNTTTETCPPSTTRTGTIRTMASISPTKPSFPWDSNTFLVPNMVRTSSSSSTTKHAIHTITSFETRRTSTLATRHEHVNTTTAKPTFTNIFPMMIRGRPTVSTTSYVICNTTLFKDHCATVAENSTTSNTLPTTTTCSTLFTRLPVKTCYTTPTNRTVFKLQVPTAPNIKRTSTASSNTTLGQTKTAYF